MEKLYLKRLSLVNFKSFNDIDLELSNKLNCFVGNNGVGKTNLFDSIYYLSFCKSYFTPQDVESIAHGKDFFTIQGQYERSGFNESVFCGVKRDQKKIFKRNDKIYSRLSEHIGLIPLVMVSPADTNLIIDGSEERRKYMTGVISQYNRQYLEDVIQYNKALTQRNRLLKDFAKSGVFDENSLEIWDYKMAELGHRIFSARKDFIEQLIPIFQKFYAYISDNSEKVNLIYRSQLEEKPMLELIGEVRAKDRLLQFSNVGIHRDDLTLELKGYPIKLQGSQGQQKTLLVALKLAQYDFLKTIAGIQPLILLDDIFDKFDDQRVMRLVELVSDHNFGQIFITDKNQKHLEAILKQVSVSGRVFQIEDGKARIQS